MIKNTKKLTLKRLTVGTLTVSDLQTVQGAGVVIGNTVPSGGNSINPGCTTGITKTR